MNNTIIYRNHPRFHYDEDYSYRFLQPLNQITETEAIYH
jgi:hypothetical protein